MQHYDWVVLKIQGIGLVMLGVVRLTGAEAAAWISIPAAILSGTYWGFKLYHEFLKKKRKDG